MPWQLIGRELAKTIQLVTTGTPPEQRRRNIPTFGVHARQSTDRSARTFNDPLVRRFIKLARTAALRGKGPGELADRLKTSQPTLYRHVTANLGRSPSKYINDIRINKACDLLRNTDLSLPEIAKACGYATASNLYLAFCPLPCAARDMATRIRTFKETIYIDGESFNR